MDTVSRMDTGQTAFVYSSAYLSHVSDPGNEKRPERLTAVVKALAALVASAILLCLPGCEKRIVRKQERVFMHYAEQNWNKLSPRQKADYYEMIERQKDRARREEARGEQGDSQGF